MVSLAYLKLLIFLPAVLIPASASSSPAFLMRYSARKLNKQGAIYCLDVLLSRFGTRHPPAGFPAPCVRAQSLIPLFTPWTIVREVPLSRELSRQEYCSGLLCLPPGNLPDPGIEYVSLLSPALAGKLFTTRATWDST